MTPGFPSLMSYFDRRAKLGSQHVPVPIMTRYRWAEPSLSPTSDLAVRLKARSPVRDWLLSKVVHNLSILGRFKHRRSRFSRF